MKKEDLRIGNLVKIAAFGEDTLPEEDVIFADLGYREFIVNAAVLKEMSDKSDYAIKPISLTHSKLIDLGAKGRKNTLWMPIFNIKAELHFECHQSGEIVTTLKSQFCDLILDRIKYVHTLQNLVYALSGEELMSAKTEA